MSDSRDLGYALLFFGFGIAGFFWGFNRLRRKRKIENIPTSTVRGLAMGPVELVGKTQKRINLASPLTQTPCVFYRYTVERYKRRRRSGDWVTIASGNSSFSPFELNDGTGKVLVFPQGAEVILPVDYEFRTGLGKPLPDQLLSFMEQNGLSYRSLLGAHPLRFREWFIQENETVYVLGTASSGNPKDDLAEGAFINQGKNEVFIISDYSQKDLLKHLGWQAFIGVFGGAALALVALSYILFRLNIYGF